MNEQFWWFLARSSGVVAWALLAGSVLLGLALSTRALGKRPAPPWLNDLHRGMSGLACIFTGLHLVGLVADSYIEFGWLEILVPFTSEWQPIPVAWGVLAMYLLIAVEGTSLLRKRIGTKVWRRFHMLSFLLYVMATAHFIFSGTDMENPVIAVMILASVLSTAVLTLIRILVPKGRAAAADRPKPAKAAAPAGGDDIEARKARAAARRAEKKAEREAAAAAAGEVATTDAEAPTPPPRPTPAPAAGSGDGPTIEERRAKAAARRAEKKAEREAAAAAAAEEQPVGSGVG